MSVSQQLHRWIWPQRGERLKAVVVYGLVTVLITAALALTGVRIFFAAAPSMINTVEAAVSSRLGVPIRIGALDARLHQLRPGLVLRDVEVGDPTAAARPVQLAEMTLAIAPWASLESGGLRLHALEAVGLEFSASRSVEGWQFSGLLPIAPAATPGDFLAALRGLPVDQLLLREARVRLTGSDAAAPLVIDPVTLRWQREESGDWRFALDARRNGETLQGQLLVPADAEGSARGFIELQDIRGATLRSLLPAGDFIPAATAGLDASLWLTLDDEGLQSATVDLNGQSLGLLGGELSAAALQARIERTAEGWTGRMIPQTMRGLNAAPLDVGALAFAYERDSGAWRWAAERLPLALIYRGFAATRLELPALALGGEIQGLQGLWSNPEDWRLRGVINEIAMEAEAPWPEIDAGRVDLRMGADGGEARLQDFAVTAGLPSLLREPVRLEALAGALRWRQTESTGWRFQTEDLTADWRGVPLRLAGSYLRPAQGKPVVDLTAELGGAPIEAVMAHLPVGVMHEQLVEYLDRAVLAGRMQSLSLRLAGSPEDFPFDSDEGVFDLVLQLDAMDFQFNRQWPALQSVAAELRFYNRGMQIQARRGQIAGVELTGAEASIDDLWQPRLLINGNFTGPLAAMHALMLDSPLLSAQSPLAPLAWEGDGALSLSLEFPFQKQPPRVSGALRLDGATLAVPRPAIRLTDLRGEVDFDGNGLRWQGLRGRFNDRALVSRAVTLRSDAGPRTRIEADTRMALADWPGLASLAGQARGDTAWRITLELPGYDQGRLASGPTHLRVTSALQGLTLDWPLQLGKTAAQSRAAEFDWRWFPDGEQRIALAYGDRLQAAARQQRGSDLGLTLHFGSQPAAAPKPGMTRITGTLPRVALAELTALGAGDGPGGIGVLPPVREVDVRLQGLDVSRWRLGEVQVAGLREGDDWRLGLAGAAYGDMRWSPAERAVRIDLETLRAATIPVAEREDREPSGAEDAPAPAGPDLHLNVESLSAEDLPLGRFSFSRINEGEPNARASLELVGESIDLRGQITPDAGQPGGHRLRFDLFTEDAGALLRALGLPRAMESGTGSSAGTLSWIGPMLDPAMTSLAGELQVDLRNGSLPAVEPGAGRALGLFSLSVLPRRLGLDFSDVVGEGLQFDSLQGSWQVQAGRMRTDDLTLQGPSMDLALSGETDLVRRRYDQQVQVTPHVSSALTFLGGLAGGPAAAVMLFLTRGMIEPGVERLTSFEYRIFGPWEDPQFELLTPLTAAEEGSGDD